MKRYATVCSGIGAPEVAVTPLGWECVFSSDIEPFPNAVRAHHFPNVPNLGDMTKFNEWPDYAIDVFIGGTPCQSFSVAGLRKGLDDPRGNLMLTYAAIAAKYRPRWILWENVPGVLSSEGGRDFAQFLGLLTGTTVEVPSEGWGSAGIVGGIDSAYGIAWRVLDAQYFGLAQRRKRVFVVGHLGGLWQRAAAVLFERESLRGDSAPIREKREEITEAIAGCLDAGEWRGPNRNQLDTAKCIPIQEISKRTGASTDDVRCGIGIGNEGDSMFTLQRAAQHGAAQPIAISISGGNPRSDRPEGGFHVKVGEETSKCLDASSGLNPNCSQGGMMVAQRIKATESWPAKIAPTLNAAFADKQGLEDQHALHGAGLFVPDAALGIPGNWIGRKPENGGNATEPMREVAPNLTGADRHGVQHGYAVRRLTPRECERLQGFPDDFTLIPMRGKPAADGPRYKALGNSMAVPNIRWICERMDLVDQLCPIETPE